jgi:peptidoglycan/LPS O-acetylase OafA/YrhL
MTNEVSVNLDKVIDKIADKVDLAVENVKPLATETIHQFQQQELLASIYNGCLAVFFFLVIGGLAVLFGLKACKVYNNVGSSNDAFPAYCLGAATFCIISLAAGGGSLSHFIDHLQAYLYPLPTLLGLN